jgi:hypothetical protein
MADVCKTVAHDDLTAATAIAKSYDPKPLYVTHAASPVGALDLPVNITMDLIS